MENANRDPRGEKRRKAAEKAKLRMIRLFVLFGLFGEGGVRLRGSEKGGGELCEECHKYWYYIKVVTVQEQRPT